MNKIVSLHLMSIKILFFIFITISISGCLKIPEIPGLYEHPKITKEYKSDKDVLMFILDGSGSMGEVDTSGKIKMLAAKSMLKDISNQLDKTKINVGLIGFNAGCSSAKMLIEPTNNNFNRLVQVSNNLRAYGKTPLAASIREAGEILKNIDKKVSIIIISDGVETCGGNPIIEAQRLKNYGIDAKIYVIGYSVDKNTQIQLENLAKSGGGHYFSAKDSTSLDTIVTNITDELDIKSENWKGKTYNFKINFDSGSSILKASYNEQIENFATYLINTGNSAELQGHTDSIGSNRANQILSQKRAQSVVNKLIKFNVPKDKVYAVGFGNLAPLASNTTKDGRYKNRRVEAHIIKNGSMDISFINEANSHNVININNAIERDFIGYYQVTDPNRSYASYHIWMELYANAQGVFGEYKNNISQVKTANKNLSWSFSKSKKMIVLDYSDNGKKEGWAKFKGAVSGTTNNFNLSGYWGGGRAGQVIMKRISKVQIDCMKLNKYSINGDCSQ